MLPPEEYGAMRENLHQSSILDRKTAGASGVADPEQLLRQEQAALMLEVTPRCLENWRHRGGGPKHVRISARCIRYRRRDLLEWVEARLCQSTSEI